MRTITTCILILALGTAPTIAQVPGYDHFVDTDHLRFAWNEGAVSEEGLDYMKAAGESYFAAIEEMLGEAPTLRVIVLLEGYFERPDGSRGYPRVDGWGRIHLYRFGPSYHDYMGAFAHELVHAMRIERKPHHDWFFEEGLAEFIALRLEEPLRGFPWYGFPVDVVAGQWLARDAGIPLAMIREKHRDINLPCKAQTYSLRSAFFDYLGKVYGNDAVLEMARQEKAGANEDYERFIGKPFDDLAAEWREATVAAFAARENAAVEAERYRSQSPIQYMPVCDREGNPLR